MWRVKWYFHLLISRLYLLLHHRCFGVQSVFYGFPRMVRPDRIICGSHLKCNPNVYLNGDGGITIGHHVTLSYGVSIIAASYDRDAFLHGERVHSNRGIHIGDHVWIGANATILDGVSICSHVIIGAGAVVTKDITVSHSVYAGVPAMLLNHVEMTGENERYA